MEPGFTPTLHRLRPIPAAVPDVPQIRKLVTDAVDRQALDFLLDRTRLAIEHGKKVFLVRSLVTSQPWAQDYVRRRGAIEVADVDEVVTRLAAPERVRQATEQQGQLALSIL